METKSKFASKINWTQVVGFAAQMLAFFGIDMPPELHATVAVIIQGVVNLVTIIQRTYFTTKLTPESVG